MKPKHSRNLSILGAIVFTANSAYGDPITQTGNDNIGTASFVDSARWSNLAVPSAGNSYFTSGWIFRTPTADANQTFAGDSLTVDTKSAASGVGATVITKVGGTKTITFSSLIMNGGIFSQGQGGATHTLAGAITAATTSGFSITDSSDRNLFVSAPISGAGRLHVGSFGQYNASDPNYVPTAYTSTFAVSGDNSSFGGGWTLGGGYDAPVFGGTGTYRVNFNASGITFRLGHVNALGTGTLRLHAGTVNLNGFSPTGLPGVELPDSASATIRTAGNILTATNLTLGSTTGANLNIDNAGLANPVSAPVVSTTFTVNGPSTIGVRGTGLSTGTFPLISHTGAIAGAGGFAGLTLALPPGVSGSLVDNPGSLDVTISNIEFIKWTGAISGNWNINSADTNWKTAVGLADTTYQQNAAGGNSVLFNESEAAPSPVAIAIPAAVSPNAISINNPTKDYTFSGQAITGTAAFVKDGAGKVTFLNTLGCTGGTTINGGKVVLSGPSPAGTTAAPVATTIASGATLEYNSAGGINQGANSYTGAGTIIKNGAGTLTFDGSNSSVAFAAPTGDANGKPKVAAKVYGDEFTANSGARIDNYGLAVNLALPVQHGPTGVFDGGLSLENSVPGVGALTLSGINTYTGNTNVPTGNSLILADNAGLTFVVDDINNNKITGTGSVTLDGDFTLDLTYANLTDGNTWNLVDVGMLAETFGGTFTITDFTEAGVTGIHTKVDGLNTWTFDEATGTLSLDIAPATGYTLWVTDPAFGLSTGDQDPAADPDNDGVENLVEYVLDGDPSVSDPSILPDLDASGANFVFSFTRREESAVDTEQVFQYGSDLTGWTPLNITAPTASEVTLGTPSGGQQTVTVTIPKGTNTTLFGRLKVVKP